MVKLINKINSFFNKKPIRYEVTILSLNSNQEADYLKEYQDKGWEICGQTEVNTWKHGFTYHNIPMRRKINN